VSLLRSLLFVPASRQRTIDSAVRSAADAVILDLEDGIGPGDKTAARDLAAVEEKVLEQMMDADVITADIKQAEAALAKDQKEIEAEKAALARELTGVEATLAEASAARTALVAQTDPKLLAMFDQVAKARKGIAICAAAVGLGVVFGIGLFGVITRRNTIGILLGIELMMNAVNINLVAFSRFSGNDVGMVFTVFAICITVAEAAMGPHDFLPLVPVVEGAGGRITDWDGRALGLSVGTKGRVLASGDPALHEQALRRLAG